MGSSLRTILAALAVCALLSAADAPSFEKTVAPVLTATCTPCHNDSMASGNLDIAAFTKPASLTANRDGWDIILRKLRAGEMPPKGIPRPAALDGAIQFLTAEFDKADRNIKPDPGRVTARRLNRAEYTNTIRDLLGVEFQAEKNFPTDDLGNGFDNIGDVLTISPVLMEKYLSAAGRIASRAVAADPHAQAAGDSVSTTKTRKSAASISAPSKPPAASSSMASTRSASACPASAGPTPSR